LTLSVKVSQNRKLSIKGDYLGGLDDI